jgi:hypothetical protein
MKPFVIGAAWLAIFLAGCSGNPNTSTAESQRVIQAKAERNVEAALASLNAEHHIKFSPTAQVYKTDSIAVHDGSEIALFPTAARITRSPSGLTIEDPQSQQTFHFSTNATIDTIIGGGRVYVEPGAGVPSWARASNARSLASR